MFTVKCSACAKEGIGLKDAVRSEGKILCMDCFRKEHPEDLIGERGIVSLSDAHYCLLCGSHRAERPYQTYDGTPICQACLEKNLSKPFPKWVQAFFAGVVLLVIVSVIWNWRFFEGYRALKSMGSGLERGDLDQVVENATDAADALPELVEVEGARRYYRGIQLLSRDSSTAALDTLRSVQDITPGMFPDLSAYQEQAALGSAYDLKDYDGFLRIAKRMRDDSANAATCDGVASAYACKFAVTGDSAYHDSANHLLDEARGHAGWDTTNIEYEQRIRYRLYSREIINAKVFAARFPNGWHQPH